MSVPLTPLQLCMRLHTGTKAAVLAACSIALGATMVHAQIAFQPVTGNVDVSRYRRADQCLAAVKRVEDSLAKAAPIYRDTTPVNSREVLDPTAPRILETAQQCGAKFQATTASLDDFFPLMQLFLLAGRRTDSLLHRRTTVLDVTNPVRADSQRALLRDTVIQAYLEVDPPNMAILDSLLQEQMKFLHVLNVKDRIEPNRLQMEKALRAGDSVWAERAIDRLLIIGGSITDIEKRNPWYTRYGRSAIYSALSARDFAQSLDSLRKSTSAFLALHRVNWKKATGEREEAFPIAIGKRSPTVQGDFWFSSASSGNGSGTQGSEQAPGAGTVRPVPGKVNLIVFLGSECRYQPQDPQDDFSGKRICLSTFGALRRLARQFPDLQVTIAAKTFGFFSQMEPPPPEREADAMRAWLLNYHHLPGTLAVAKLPFIRLPQPDNRRVNLQGVNEVRFSFGDNPQYINPTNTYLIDPDGIVAMEQPLNRYSESMFSELIRILSQR